MFVEDFVFTWSRDGQIYSREMILPNVVPTPAFDPMVEVIPPTIARRASFPRLPRSYDCGGELLCGSLGNPQIPLDICAILRRGALTVEPSLYRTGYSGAA